MTSDDSARQHVHTRQITYMHASWPDRMARIRAIDADPRGWPDLSALRFIGQCHAWREDGEALRREYPELNGNTPEPPS